MPDWGYLLTKLEQRVPRGSLSKKAAEERLKAFATWLNGTSLGLVGFGVIQPLSRGESLLWWLLGASLVALAGAQYLLGFLKDSD